MSSRKDVDFSMSNAQALIGKENWLFLCDDTNRCVEQNQGVLRLSPEGLKRWLRTLESRFAMLKSKDIQYYFFVAPNKECVYSEKLPQGYQVSEKRIIHQLLIAASESGFHLHYPLELLKLYKNEWLLYPKGNTHWNGMGAFIAYQYLINVVKKEYHVSVLSWEDIYFEDIDTKEDLGNKLIPPRIDKFTWARVKNPQAQIIYDNGCTNSGRIQVSLNKRSWLPTAVIFHDSFMEMMLPFFMESFGKIYFMHTPRVDYDVVDKIKPDIVISEMVERFLLQKPIDF